MTKQETPTVDEKLWNAWRLRGKRDERESADRMKRFAGVVLIVTTIVAAAFLLTK